MNIVTLTNKIALISVVGLMYWVFIFVSSSVFGFKVFRENMTEIFLLSILGIFAILLGSIILNIMYNLTAIAEGKKNIEKTKKGVAYLGVIFVASLFVIFFLLFVGDRLTSKKKESYLVSAASDLVKEQSEVIDRISKYRFTKEYLRGAAQDIQILSKVEEKFPSITVIVQDEIEGKSYLLGLGRNVYISDEEEPVKSRYILSTSSEERQYLKAVFEGKQKEPKFSSSDGRYELYYPVINDNGVFVMHLSHHSRYGKIGS